MATAIVAGARCEVLSPVVMMRSMSCKYNAAWSTKSQSTFRRKMWPNLPVLNRQLTSNTPRISAFVDFVQHPEF
jgi:hypothetical protein